MPAIFTIHQNHYNVLKTLDHLQIPYEVKRKDANGSTKTVLLAYEYIGLYNSFVINYDNEDETKNIINRYLKQMNEIIL